MIKCIKTFLTNEYPVIIIESKNSGGSVLLYSVLLQILQTRIEMRDSMSYRVTKISEEYLKLRNPMRGKVSISDCKIINSYQDFNKFYSDSYGEETINHNRTNPIDKIDKLYRLALREFREEIKNNKNLKKPTDIIIFTDSYSVSAASGLIKGFQNTGGAVVVGFYGNPKIEGTDLYDGSQSPSSVEKFNEIKINAYIQLEKLGFKTVHITMSETFFFHQLDKINQIPREYALDPVDFRVNIYSDYSDKKYDQFIDEGLSIYKLINQDNKCNPKNDKLLLHSDNCKNINGYDHAHGGYKCNNQGEWDNTDCQPYYCDFGYIFDQIQKKCIKNCNFENEKSYFIYEDNFYGEFNIEKNKKYTFIFLLHEKHNYTYEKPNKKYIVTSGKKLLTVNGAKNYDYNLKLMQNDTKSKYINLNNKKKSKVSINKPGSTLISLEDSDEDFVLYSDNIYQNPETKMKIAKYDDEMDMDDMLNCDSKYYSDFNDNIHIFKKDETYLLNIKSSEIDSLNIFVSPVSKQEIIEINDIDSFVLYLEKDKIYTLNIKNNLIKRMIKLSRETLKSEIIIEDKNIVLNSNNLYYKIEDNYEGEIKLNIKNDNAIIELLVKQDDSEIEILDFEKKIFQLNKKYNILTIPKEYKSKLIDIELNRNEFLTDFTISLAYSIPPYNYFSDSDEENIFTMDEKFTFTINEHYKGDINLMKNEYYCVMIENFGEDVLMSLNIREEKKNAIIDYIKNLEGWKIALIIVVIIIGAVIIFFVICHFRKNKNQQQN